jgi:nitronate monooxygenase
VLDNDAAKQVAELEANGVDDLESYRPLIAGSRVMKAYTTGDYAEGMIDMGPAGVFAREIKPVEAIFDEIIDAAVAALNVVKKAETTRVSNGRNPAVVNA